ncbi:ArnT family glycosyltransferase [Amycolatopsis sp. NPDC001319]|uniref:ArnT family glycosyltransferase n=1 Tax=unclassified Amycolatopsis TaxID=2618356 RepID=UPI003674E416
MVIIRSPLEPRVAVARPFAWPAISVVALCTALALLVEAGRQSLHGDELYFLSAAQHLSWGYADQGALVPFLAWLGDGSPLTLRIPAVLATVAGVLLTALLAQEFGGGRWAQTAAAAAYAASPRVLDTGSLLLTQTFDIPLWIATTLLLVRWARTGSDRLWWGMGLLAGVAFTVKPLIAVFWMCCVAVLLATRRRRVPWAGLGKLAALAVAGASPYLIWQGFHGFPQLTLVPVVAQETGEFAGGKVAVLPLTLASNGALAGAALAVYGCWALLRDSRLAPYRFLGWTCVAVAAVMLVAGGRYYYCAGLFPVCWAAATARISTTVGSHWWRRIASVGVSAFSGAVVLIISLFAGGPSSWATGATLESRSEQDWSTFTDAVATAYNRLPPTTTIITDHYWQASALNWYGAGLGLPPAHSPHRGFSYFGQPSDPGRPVLFVSTDPTELRTPCVRMSATPSDADHGFAGLNQSVPIWLCDAPRQSWETLWPQLRHS